MLFLLHVRFECCLHVREEIGKPRPFSRFCDRLLAKRTSYLRAPRPLANSSKGTTGGPPTNAARIRRSGVFRAREAAPSGTAAEAAARASVRRSMVVFSSNKRREGCARMPGKITNSTARPPFRAAQGTEWRQHLASALRKARKSANIYTALGDIREIPDI